MIIKLCGVIILHKLNVIYRVAETLEIVCPPRLDSNVSFLSNPRILRGHEIYSVYNNFESVAVVCSFNLNQCRNVTFPAWFLRGATLSMSLSIL